MTKKAKKAPRTAAKRPTSPAPANPKLRKLLWVTLAAAATGLGLHAGVQGLREAAGALPENKLNRSMLQVTPQPSWVTVDLTEKILADADLDLSSAKLTDRDLLRRVAAAFEGSPWVKTVRIKSGVRVLHVEVEYRKPVLSIPWKDWACYLSSDGVVLPPDPETDKQAFRRCLILELPSDSEPPKVGQRFTDPSVLAAARLAELLGEAVERMRLLSITASADGRITLSTKGGSKVEWGRTSSSDDDVARKLALLETACDARHRLDGPGAPLRYDLTADVRSLVGQPLAPKKR